MTMARGFAVFYATDSKVLRRKVIPDCDAQLEALHPAPGESMLLLPLSRPHDDASCRAAIASATGVPPPSGRCCIIGKSGDVIALCNADPALDTHPEGQIVACENAGLGDRYVDGVFLRRYRVAHASSDAVASTAWLPICEPAISPGRNLVPSAALEDRNAASEVAGARANNSG